MQRAACWRRACAGSAACRYEKILQTLRLRAEGLFHAGVFQKTRRLAMRSPSFHRAPVFCGDDHFKRRQRLRPAAESMEAAFAEPVRRACASSRPFVPPPTRRPRGRSPALRRVRAAQGHLLHPARRPRRRHARGEVIAHGAEDDGAAAGHVLAAVVAHAPRPRPPRRNCARRSARLPRRRCRLRRWSRRRGRRCR